MTAVVEPAEGGGPRVAGISYVGFSKKYDETIELGAGRLRPLDLGPPVEGPSQPLRPDAAQPGGDIYVVDRVLEVPLASSAPTPLGSHAPCSFPELHPRAPPPSSTLVACTFSWLHPRAWAAPRPQPPTTTRRATPPARPAARRRRQMRTRSGRHEYLTSWKGHGHRVELAVGPV